MILVNSVYFIFIGAPLPPSGFNVTKRTPNSITVQWNRSDEVTYLLQYRVNNSNEQWIQVNLQNDVTSYTVNNLEPNTSYELRITSLKMSTSSFPRTITTRTRISGTFY